MGRAPVASGPRGRDTSDQVPPSFSCCRTGAMTWAATRAAPLHAASWNRLGMDRPDRASVRQARSRPFSPPAPLRIGGCSSRTT